MFSPPALNQIPDVKASSQSSRRYLGFDVARTAAFIWVVFCCHLLHLSSAGLGHLANDCVLGLFFFISGTFAGKHDFYRPGGIFAFYKKRILRIYPLYLIAIWTMPESIFHERIFATVCLSPYFIPMIRTLWFVGLLITYYALTPILCRAFRGCEGSLKRALGVFLATYAIFYLAWKLFPGNVEQRLILFFPVYYWGLVIGASKSRFNRLATLSARNFFFREDADGSRGKLNVGIVLENAILAATLVAFFGISVLRRSTCADFRVLISQIGILFAIPWFHMIANAKIWEKLAKPISLLAYVSFACYLFHRQIYAVVDWLGDKGLNLGGTIPVVCVKIALVIFAGWLIQKVYDFVVALFERKRA